MILTREQIRSARETTSPVDVPEWGDGAQVLVKKPGLREALAMVGAFDGEMTPETVISAVIGSVVDESGKPVFAPEDKEWLIAEKSAAALLRIANHAMGVAAKVAGPSENAEKNS